MRYIVLLFLFCSFLTDSFAQNDTTTNEQIFFTSIYKKYPNAYFPLGSRNTFSEYFNSKTKKSIWTLSFLIIDSTKKDEKKYLSEISDTILKKYLATTLFYYGKHSCHWELGVSGLDFVAFLNNDEGDYVFDTTETGFKSSFIKNLIGITVVGKNEQEKFGSSLLTLLTPELLLGYLEFKKIKTNFTWTKNRLIITNTYIKQKEYQSTDLHLVFEKDKLIGMSLK